MGQRTRLPYRSERSALRNAIHRCHNDKHQSFKDYGARGITVQDELRTKYGWKLLVDTIGPKPAPHYTLDRIDNDGDYSVEPLNIRWADRKTQQRNRRPSKTPMQDFGWGFGTKAHGTGSGSASLSPLLPHMGRIQTLAEWAVELNMNSATIRQRLRRGLTVAEALNPSTSRKGEKHAPKRALLISPTIH